MTKEEKIALFEKYKKQHLENCAMMDKIDPIFGIGNDYSDRLGFTMDGWLDALAFVFGDTEDRLCDFIYEGEFGNKPYEISINDWNIVVRDIGDVLDVITLDKQSTAIKEVVNFGKYLEILRNIL